MPEPLRNIGVLFLHWLADDDGFMYGVQGRR